MQRMLQNVQLLVLVLVGSVIVVDATQCVIHATQDKRGMQGVANATTTWVCSQIHTETEMADVSQGVFFMQLTTWVGGQMHRKMVMAEVMQAVTHETHNPEWFCRCTERQ